eukprot:1151847-Pelagomonas_calceolata.AAC.1
MSKLLQGLQGLQGKKVSVKTKGLCMPGPALCIKEEFPNWCFRRPHYFPNLQGSYQMTLTFLLAALGLPNFKQVMHFNAFWRCTSDSSAYLSAWRPKGKKKIWLHSCTCLRGQLSWANTLPVTKPVQAGEQVPKA